MSNNQEMYINLAKAAMNALDRGSLGQAIQILQLMTKTTDEPQITHKPPKMPQNQSK